MMHAAWLIPGLMFIGVQEKKAEETTRVALTVKAMHCDECKSSLEANLKALPGVKSVEFSGDKLTATVEILEKQPVHLKSLRACVPSDLKLEKVALTIRGNVQSFGMLISLIAKDSKTQYELGDRDPQKAGKLNELRGALGGGKTKFKIVGELIEREKREILIVDSFEAAEWEEEKEEEKKDEKKK
ncbi:MAG: cation transporter [Planctomycetes bacterium]|nr:cation transporter [Planctomycetota bacterium]